MQVSYCWLIFLQPNKHLYKHVFYIFINILFSFCVLIWTYTPKSFSVYSLITEISVSKNTPAVIISQVWFRERTSVSYWNDIFHNKGSFFISLVSRHTCKLLMWNTIDGTLSSCEQHAEAAATLQEIDANVKPGRK